MLAIVGKEIFRCHYSHFVILGLRMNTICEQSSLALPDSIGSAISLTIYCTLEESLITLYLRIRYAFIPASPHLGWAISGL